ncbi:MAG: hypothetical protein IMW89_12720 [Ktedonobacteraceae bacterium]|nr:hypothetical protein [Ktedonobacteraceae bacterium]
MRRKRAPASIAMLIVLPVLVLIPAGPLDRCSRRRERPGYRGNGCLVAGCRYWQYTGE